VEVEIKQISVFETFVSPNKLFIEKKMKPVTNSPYYSTAIYDQ